MTESKLDRRALLLGGVGLALAACTDASAQPRAGNSAAERRYTSDPARRVTDAQWRSRLPASSYDVLRHEGTETPGTSPLLAEHRRGTFVCRGCDLPLFQSDWKFESGTGWPSFFRVIEANVGRMTDNSMLMVRNEYHCARCLGHQGHVFDDGPRPTGLRYCNNGVALRFVPA